MKVDNSDKEYNNIWVDSRLQKRRDEKLENIRL